MRGAPDYLETLIDRWEPGAFDAPDHKARIRLEVVGKGSWDAVIRDKEARLREETDQPDALITADAATWQKIADDLPAGMDAYNKGRLRIRHNLHLGVGFLAATSGITDEGRLEFHRVKTKKCHISYVQAGTGDPGICI